MSEERGQGEVKIEEKTGQRRKLIQKVRRKVKRENQRLSSAYSNFAKEPRSGLGSYMNKNPQQQSDFDMTNQITMGQNRKLKKKLKKLQKKMPQNPDKIFNEMQKFKKSIYDVHIKKIFNPVKEMEKRREKRRDTREKNAKKRKNQILQKNMERFE